MSLSIRFLGTSASRPTTERNVAAVAVMREGETMLFDCGEGTHRQMMRYHISFALADVFFTHFHADHVIGIIGLMRTLALQGRQEPLHCWGPRGGARVLRRAEQFGFDLLQHVAQVAREGRSGSGGAVGVGETLALGDQSVAKGLSRPWGLVQRGGH